MWASEHLSPKGKSWTKMPRKPVSREKLRRPDAGREVVSMTQRCITATTKKWFITIKYRKPFR